jgi:hypothetical protein
MSYYNQLPGKKLGYPQWGIYGPNRNKTDVIFHANPEFGTTDLSARIASPLPIFTPAGGWV